MLDGRSLLESAILRTFDCIRSALEFTVDSLISKGHGYIIDVIGPAEVENGSAATIQIIARGMIRQDSNPGLTLHLPFDLLSDECDHLRHFEAMDDYDRFEEYLYQGISCFIATFGTDLDAAEAMTLKVLNDVYDYPPYTEFICEVSDQGPMRKAGKWRAPPGGITMGDSST